MWSNFIIPNNKDRFLIENVSRISQGCGRWFLSVQKKKLRHTHYISSFNNFIVAVIGN